MALKTDEDKAKVRTAIKIYLSLKGSATAAQLSSFILDCKLNIRANISPTVIAKELDYLMEMPCSFLKVDFYYDTKKRKRYYIVNKYAGGV